MLLIDETQPQSDDAAAEAGRLARSERRRARVRDAGVLTGVVSIVAGILFVVLLSPGGLLADDGDSGSPGDARPRFPPGSRSRQPPTRQRA